MPVNYCGCIICGECGGTGNAWREDKTQPTGTDLETCEECRGSGTDKAVAEGIKLARGIFALRGDHFEIHLKESELAAQLALAFKHGVRAAMHDLAKMIDPGKMSERKAEAFVESPVARELLAPNQHVPTVRDVPDPRVGAAALEDRPCKQSSMPSIHTSESLARLAVKDGGGQWVGIQEVEGTSYGLTLFNSPMTGSTLALLTNGITADKVRRRIEEHNALFQQK